MALLTDCGDGWYIWCMIFGIFRAYKKGDDTMTQDFCSFEQAKDYVKKQREAIN